MGSAVPQSAAEILRRIFDVVLEEATNQPEFAEKLLRSLPFDAVARIEIRGDGTIDRPSPRKAPPAPENSEKTRMDKTEAEPFDPNAFSLVVGLKVLGEAGLREKLKLFNARQLFSMVEEQHLDVDDKVFKNRKKSSREMIDAIIDALQARITGRITAAS
jgi:hypothetical protein